MVKNISRYDPSREFEPWLTKICINTYRNTLRRIALEADDLYQDTWLQVVKNISRYDPSREFEPWLTKICINTYRNTLRRIAPRDPRAFLMQPTEKTHKKAGEAQPLPLFYLS